ncbi:MAG: hypothetical protein ACK58C_11330 [Betaproteobacteria bacterium]
MQRIAFAHRLVAGWWVSGAGEMAAQASYEADGIAEQDGSFDAFFGSSEFRVGYRA